MIDKSTLQYGDEIIWTASAKRKKDMRVRVLDITDKTIVCVVLAESRDSTKKYYLREAWVRRA